MSGGLLALLDDVASIANVAAASLDDVVSQTATAGAKATGIVIDDAAVTPRYVVGFAAERELPIIGKIALGSLINKLAYLLPGGLLLNLIAPWAIPPLLMAGGVYLCFEGFEKVHSLFAPHHGQNADPSMSGLDATGAQSAAALEEEKVAGAIRTDMILSAEIMALTLASVATASVGIQITVLAVVGIGITALVYGTVALIVKADDAGVALVRRGGTTSVALGRILVKGMPALLKGLSLVGTAAMLWVGGGILIHGLTGYGFHGLEQAIHAIAHSASAPLGFFAGFANWLVSAALAGMLGILTGFFAELVWVRFRQQKGPAQARP
jgi:uncharacterized protein